MGDVDAKAELSEPAGQKLQSVIDSAFDGQTYGGKTWGVVIVKDGKIVGEGNGSPQMDIYRAGGTVKGRASSNMLDTLPGTRFLYKPPDTMLMVRAVREHIGNDARFLELPYTELFWKIGMTRTFPTSDWNGDFLMSGQTYSTARDFARFGLLYLAAVSGTKSASCPKAGLNLSPPRRHISRRDRLPHPEAMARIFG